MNANLCRNAISSSLWFRSNIERFLQVWDLERRMVSDPQAAPRVHSLSANSLRTGGCHGLEPPLDIPFSPRMFSPASSATDCSPSSFMVQILFLKLLRTEVKMKARSSRRCFGEFPGLCLSAWPRLPWLWAGTAIGVSWIQNCHWPSNGWWLLKYPYSSQTGATERFAGCSAQPSIPAHIKSLCELSQRARASAEPQPLGWSSASLHQPRTFSLAFSKETIGKTLLKSNEQSSVNKKWGEKKNHVQQLKEWNWIQRWLTGAGWWVFLSDITDLAKREHFPKMQKVLSECCGKSLEPYVSNILFQLLFNEDWKILLDTKQFDSP